jgi:peptidoglycan/xylan/chitin deacetylase (PgdA/CDA1 family)
MRLPMRPRTLVLCYHAISDDWPAALAVPGDDLEQQVRGLLRRGFEPTTFSRAIVDEGRGATLAVTFDDAFRSVYERAFPILSRLGIPATVFVPSAHAGDGSPMVWPGIDRWAGTPWKEELIGSTWDELRTLADAGWEIGSHTRSHPRLTALSEVDLRNELRGSREDCERELRRACNSIAYPYGDVNARVAAAAAEAGYTAGAALPGRFEGSLDSPDRLRWPRVGIYRGDRGLRLAGKVTLLHRAPGAWNLAQGVRQRVRRSRG